MCSNEPNPISSQAAAEVLAEATNVSLHARPDYQPPAVRRANLILGPTGPFRPLIERYLATVVPSYYKPETLVQVRSSVGKFFRFVVQDQGIKDLDQIRPSTITRFIESERGRGLTSMNFIGHISSFFVWLISLELYDRGNPVIARLHRSKMS